MVMCLAWIDVLDRSKLDLEHSSGSKVAPWIAPTFMERSMFEQQDPGVHRGLPPTGSRYNTGYSNFSGGHIRCRAICWMNWKSCIYMSCNRQHFPALHSLSLYGDCDSHLVHTGPRSLDPKHDLDPFSHFCRVQVCVRQTDKCTMLRNHRSQ